MGILPNVVFFDFANDLQTDCIDCMSYMQSHWTKPFRSLSYSTAWSMEGFAINSAAVITSLCASGNVFENMGQVC